MGKKIGKKRLTWEALARANPPPRRKMTPQHIFVSISLHVIKDGEFWIWLKIELLLYLI